ncbi:sensor histidine kinase, partial [marine sediment metagenome]
ARLFQPFWRKESSAKNDGLGLGLFIASEIAKAHQGSLSVSSDFNGTEFTFRFPLTRVSSIPYDSVSH